MGSKMVLQWEGTTRKISCSSRLSSIFVKIISIEIWKHTSHEVKYRFKKYELHMYLRVGPSQGWSLLLVFGRVTFCPWAWSISSADWSPELSRWVLGHRIRPSLPKFWIHMEPSFSVHLSLNWRGGCLAKRCWMRSLSREPRGASQCLPRPNYMLTFFCSLSITVLHPSSHIPAAWL